MKQLTKIILKYFGMVDIEIRVEQISNGYLVNNKYVPDIEEAQKEVLDIIQDPGILYSNRK